MRHGEEFVPLMFRNDPEESRIVAHEAQLNEGLRSTYRIRAKTTAMAPPSPHYPPGLADDVRELVVQLDAAQDQPHELLTFLEKGGLLPPTRNICIVEVGADTPTDEHGRLQVGRCALQDPIEYEVRFESLMSTGLPWLNLSCIGVAEGRLIHA